MPTRSKLVLAGLTASLLMAFAVGSVSARNLSVTNQNFRAVFNPLTFFGEGGIEAEVRCPVTLEGTFHYSTIAKVEKALIGYVTRAIVGNANCTRGHATVLTETLPWHVTYNGFTGTLPRITGIRLLLRTVAFLVEIGIGSTCLYAENNSGREARGTAAVETGGAITSLIADNTIRLGLVRGTFGCPPEGGFEGAGAVTVLGRAERITVRLI